MGTVCLDVDMAFGFQMPGMLEIMTQLEAWRTKQTEFGSEALCLTVWVSDS